MLIINSYINNWTPTDSFYPLMGKKSKRRCPWSIPERNLSRCHVNLLTILFLGQQPIRTGQNQPISIRVSYLVLKIPCQAHPKVMETDNSKARPKTKTPPEQLTCMYFNFSAVSSSHKLTVLQKRGQIQRNLHTPEKQTKNKTINKREIRSTQDTDLN